MKTIREARTQFQESLQSTYPREEIDAILYLALSHLTDLSKAQLKAYPEKNLSNSQQTHLQVILSNLQSGQPIQYLLGETEFYGLTFKVSPSVLIPRPETEELVDWALKTAIEKELSNLKILDIGTGSGCIAISLKKKLAAAEVFAMDLSADALKTAQVNAELNATSIHFVQDDILNPSRLSHLNLLTLIISNPPYVTPEDKMRMHKNVVDFEPYTALFVPQEDPLLFYRAIADFSLIHLEKGAYLFLEINESFGLETVELLKLKGFQKVELRKDMQDKDRMIRAQL